MIDKPQLELQGRPPNLIERLRDLSILLYAVSLSLGITWQWAVLLVGLTLSLILIACRPKPSEQFVKECLLIWRAPLTVPILVFVLAATASGWANGGALEAWRSFTSLRGMLVYFWAYQAFASKPSLKEKAIICALSVGAIAGVWAAVQQLTGLHPSGFHYLQGTGFLGGPMAFAGLMQIFSMLAFGLTVNKSYRNLSPPFSKKRVFTFVVLGNALGILFAAERSAWLGIILALMCSTMLLSFRRTFRMVIVLLAVAALLWCTVPVVQQRLSPLVNWQTDVSVRVRFQLWRQSWQIFTDKPLFGVGIRNFPHQVIPEALGQGHAALDHAHSNYMHILATTGIVGFAAYFFLFLSVLLTVASNLKLSMSCDRQNRTNTWSAQTGIEFGILAGVVSLLVSGIFEYNFGTAQIRLAQWFLFGMFSQVKGSNNAGDSG